MDLQVAGLEELEAKVGDALHRIGELQAGTHVDSDTFFSQQFMRDHTEFDSFGAFCAQSPWTLKTSATCRTSPASNSTSTSPRTPTSRRGRG